MKSTENGLNSSGWGISLETIIAQLKQRQVFKVATIYAVSAWPLIQIADLAVPALGLPDSAMTLLLQIFIAGFPVSLIFAWLFNFTAAGIVRTNSDLEQIPHEPKANTQATIAVVGSLLLVFLATLGTQLLFDKTPSTVAVEQANVPAPSAKPVQVPVIKKESIAVLPFVPFSDDPADEFFADGMVEELLNLLVQIPDLKVAARTSSFAYKGVSNKTILEIGQELGVDTILEGSIRKNDVTNKIRVSAQLIKVSTGEHLWSESYDREYRDVFQIQDDIANAVVDKMKVTLLGSSKSNAFVKETTNVDAMVAYGKGQSELGHRTASSLTKALEHFQLAISLDANYARAYVGIADANLLLSSYGNLPVLQANKNAQEAIDHALVLNDKLGAAYASQGLLLMQTDSVKAEPFFKKAIELNPNYSMAYMWYGSLQQNNGLLEEAHKLFIQALELDPKSPVAAFNVAWGYYLEGAEHKAMEIFSQIIANDPYYPGAYILVGNILSNRGRLDQAISMFKRALDVDHMNTSAVSGLIKTSIDMENITLAEQWFDYINTNPEIMSISDLNLLKTTYYISQGNKAEALHHLEQVDVSDRSPVFKYYIDGEKAFYIENYEMAITAFETLRRKNKNSPGAFYFMADGQAAIHLAYAYQQQGEFAKATEIINGYESFLQRDKNKTANSPQYYYNMALVRSLQSKTDEAYYYMQGAIDAGWVQVWSAEFEPVFKNINQESQFVKMMGGVSARLTTMRVKMDADNEFLLADSDGF